MGAVSRSTFLGEPNDGHIRNDNQTLDLALERDLKRFFNVVTETYWWDSSKRHIATVASLSGSHERKNQTNSKCVGVYNYCIHVCETPPPQK